MITPLLLTTLLAASPAPAADPCESLAALPGPEACADQPLCSPRQRTAIACAVRDVLEKRYVFFGVKDRLLSSSLAGGGPRFDSRRHLDRCAFEERALAREDDPLRFYDRMRRCTAAFEDGHLQLGSPARFPQVALGIGLRWVEGRVYVANREKKLLSYLEASAGSRDLGEILATGNEVVSIDGRPAVERLNELSQLLPASSLAARLERAADALTRRDFAYPDRRTCPLVVMVDGQRRAVELPWWIGPDAERNPMTSAYVRRLGLATTDLLTWRYDAGSDTWERDAITAQGAGRTDTILAPRDAAALHEYRDEQDRPAVRLGEVVRRRDRAFCYLQILTFQAEALADREGRREFAGTLQDFVKRCQEKELDLVLDLRQNEGGFLAHSSALMAMLGEPQRQYPGGALLVRANTMNQLVYAQRARGGSASVDADDNMDPRAIAEAIGAAAQARSEFAPAFFERPLRASGGGYTGRVVALIAPTCMSACDRLAALLKRSARATLVGAPTEGAGGSQQETRNLPVRWSDPEGLLSLSIPNAAMGVQPAPLVGSGPEGRGKSERSAEAFFRALAFENHPVVPDIPYVSTPDDLQHANRGWLRQAETVLFERPVKKEGGRPPSRSPSEEMTAAR